MARRNPMKPGSATQATGVARDLHWSRYKFPESLYSYALWIIVLSFLAFSVHYLDIPLGRIPNMFERMASVLSNRYYPPDIEYIMDRDYMGYVVETIQMAYLGALFGLLASVPLGWFGAFNMTPSRRFVYPVARLVTMAFRAVHEMIWAILFVSVLGFGMLAGVLALSFFCAGFAGKLFAEEIEAIDMGPVEAMRATGANLFQIMVFGVFPQVRVAFTGIGIYTWDVAFRAATVVGFVGAGGMGWYLKRNVLQIETERVAAILLSIVVLVLISEALSAFARNRVMRMK
jgi:phosphonate transport system permease protein